MNNQTKIKICGLARPEDAELAARLGAWALGVIFAEGSPRRVSIAQAAEVLAGAPPDVERVGVFVNSEAAEIAEAARTCGLTIVQLHGEESTGECMEAQKVSGCQVIKAFRVAGPESLEGVVRFDTDFVLLDTYHPERRGGTGEVFDWSLASGLPAALRSERLILSGGLGPQNIIEALRAVEPFAADISSGVEKEPGIKDPARLERLFDILKENS